jgi:malate synthase
MSKRMSFSQPLTPKEADTTCSLLSYCSAWISGNGCVPINYLMEDAATAEIARVQLWQWVHYAIPLTLTGQVITSTYIDKVIDSFAPNVAKKIAGVKEEHVGIAAKYLRDQIRKEWPSDFLTSDLMERLEQADGVKWVKSAL